MESKWLIMGCKLFTLADSQSEFVDVDMLILNVNHYIVQVRSDKWI